jgi:membrane protease YdiL (CAAX protease family)
MSAVLTDTPLSPPTTRGRPLLAWLVIAGVVGFILWEHATEPEAQKEGLDLLTMQLQARAAVGLADLFKGNAPALYQQLQSLDRGPYRQRLCFVVLTGELQGKAQARAELEKLDATWEERGIALDAEDAELEALLRRLYAEQPEGQPEVPALSKEEQAQLRRDLGWFGDLALAPPWGADADTRQKVLAPARRGAIVNVVAALFMGLLIVVGAVLLILLFLLWLLRVIRGKFRSGARHGGIYAETFAVYLLLFVVIGHGGGYFLRHLPGDVLRQWGLLFSALAALLSLAALAWPVIRGIPWQWVRHDVGLYLGRRPALEPVLGLGCYATAWPLLLVGLLLSFGIKMVREHVMGPPDPFGPTGDPAHPLVQIVTSHNWLLWVQAFFVAGVVAPIVEETMFRGVLYRHLREASARFGPVLSFLASALAVSFVFAVIHPQGIQGVPVLMALAFSFTLAREWRGTLLPSMVAHGLNNTAITFLLLMMVT